MHEILKVNMFPVTTSGVETTSTRSTTSVSIETTTPIGVFIYSGFLVLVFMKLIRIYGKIVDSVLKIIECHILKVCTRPLQAKLCGRNVTCKDKIQTTSCVPGCFCPDGMFRDGLRCVENTDCPCFVDDQR